MLCFALDASLLSWWVPLPVLIPICQITEGGRRRSSDGATPVASQPVHLLMRTRRRSHSHLTSLIRDQICKVTRILTWTLEEYPPRHNFQINVQSTIYLYTTNSVRLSLNLVSIMVHLIRNTLFAVQKVGVANGHERPHYYWKKRNMWLQFCCLLIPSIWSFIRWLFVLLPGGSLKYFVHWR